MYEFRIDHARRCVLATWSGTISAREVRSYVRALTGHPDFRPGLAALHDMRGYVPWPSGGNEVEDIAGQSAGADIEMAIRATAYLVETDLQFGVMRMYTAWRETEAHPVLVTRSLERAKMFVGLYTVADDPFDARTRDRYGYFMTGMM